jgi:hypothetical protein
MATFSAKPADWIGGSLIAFHGISSKRWLHLQAWENDCLYPGEILKIPCAHFPDVFSTLLGSQTHCCIDSTWACVDLSSIVP